jgi:hypothetical protein
MPNTCIEAALGSEIGWLVGRRTKRPTRSGSRLIVNLRDAGKVVVITGASSGLGEASARFLSAQGASVLLDVGASKASSH